MAKKKPVGRPKMAQNKLKKAFPLRLRPDLIKQIKANATERGVKLSEVVEHSLDFYFNW